MHTWNHLCRNSQNNGIKDDHDQIASDLEECGSGGVRKREREKERDKQAMSTSLDQYQDYQVGLALSNYLYPWNISNVLSSSPVSTLTNKASSVIHNKMIGLSQVWLWYKSDTLWANWTAILTAKYLKPATYLRILLVHPIAYYSTLPS